MKVVVVNQGNGLMQVGVDGVFYDGLLAEGLASNVHAIQWRDTYGEIEIKDAVTDKIVRNEQITSIADYQFAVVAWDNAHLAHQKAAAAAEAAAAAAEAEAAAAEAEAEAIAQSTANEG